MVYWIWNGTYFIDGDSESLWYKYATSIINLYRSTIGASEHYLQRNLEITRDVTCLGPLSRLINVLESGDIWGLRPNTIWTKPCMNLNGVVMKLELST